MGKSNNENNDSAKSPIRIVIVGAKGSGKSSLLTRYCDGQFSEMLTSGFNYYHHKKALKIGDITRAVQMWDLSRDEKLLEHKANGVIILIDLTNGDALSTLEEQFKSAKLYAQDNACYYLVGTKFDLRTKVALKFADIMESAQKAVHHCELPSLQYQQVSSKPLVEQDTQTDNEDNTREVPYLDHAISVEDLFEKVLMSSLSNNPPATLMIEHFNKIIKACHSDIGKNETNKINATLKKLVTEEKQKFILGAVLTLRDTISNTKKSTNPLRTFFKLTKSKSKTLKHLDGFLGVWHNKAKDTEDNCKRYYLEQVQKQTSNTAASSSSNSQPKVVNELRCFSANKI